MKHLLALFFLLLTGVVFAQSTSSPQISCDTATFQTLQVRLVALKPSDANYQQELFTIGQALQVLSLACGYAPQDQEVNATIGLTLSLTDLKGVIAYTAIGADVQVALQKLEGVYGDSYTGQLLYNGLENSLDGLPLGCAGCHNGETAPSIEGTWTRANDERLALPQFADYSVQQYLVESILHPESYIVEGYQSNLMPTNYGNRLDAQQLADLVAFLESQDQ
jgi:hypothetical protein